MITNSLRLRTNSLATNSLTTNSPCLPYIEGGRKVNYYTAHAAERLKKQEEAEAQYFGGAGAKEIMRELYDQGLAGTGALAAKLTHEYFEYSRGDWLRQTLTRLLEYELQLRSERALLGATDGDVKDALAAKEVESTLDDGARALTARFVSEKLIAEGTLFHAVEAEMSKVNGKEVGAHEIDSTLRELKATIHEHVDVAVEAVESFYTGEIKKMLDAPIRVSPAEATQAGKVPPGTLGERTAEAAAAATAAPPPAPAPAPGALSARFWMGAGQLVRSFFGTSEPLPASAVELHRRVIAQPIIQLGAHPEFTQAIADVVTAECGERRKKIECAAEAVLEHVAADVSQYVHVQPSEDMQLATLRFKGTKGERGRPYFADALKAAFMRHLPTHAQLKRAVLRKEIKLSSFAEDEETARKRRELDERLVRVCHATCSLVRALDVDETSPLDTAWLAQLQSEHGLPQDDSILFTEGELTTALGSFETFHRLAPGAASVPQLQRSSTGIGGWLRASAEARAAKAAKAATAVQTAARGRAAVKASAVLSAEVEVNMRRRRLCGAAALE